MRLKYVQYIYMILYLRDELLQALVRVLLCLDSAQRRLEAPLDAKSFASTAEELQSAAFDLEKLQKRLRQGGQEASKVLSGEEVSLEELGLEVGNKYIRLVYIYIMIYDI